MAERQTKRQRERQMKINHLVAVLVGANKMAADTETFGERLYWRMMRDNAAKGLKEMGAEIDVDRSGQGEVVSKLGPLPRAILAAVAKWDAERSAADDEAIAPEPAAAGETKGGGG